MSERPSPEPRIVPSVKDVADAIKGAGPRKEALGKVVFLIGAGCSVSARIPSAVEIAKIMTRDIAARFELCAEDADCVEAYQLLVRNTSLSDAGGRLDSTGKVEGLVNWYNVYDEMFQRHYCVPDTSRDLFGRIVEQAEGAINWAHLCLGELTRRRYVSTVLTTNFDQLVLSGMVRAGLLPVVCDGVESLNRIASVPRHPQLVELHGSRHTYLLRNRPDDVAEIWDNRRASAAIQGLFQHATTFVVVGYGGREVGVMDLLIDSAKIFRDKNLYWIQYSSDPHDLSPKAKDFLATSRNGGLLIGQDADTFFLELCRELGVGAPTAISDPLGSLRRIIGEVEQATMSQADIRAEISRAKSRLDTLGEALAKAERTIDDVIAEIREKRLAGDHAEAYRLAEGAGSLTDLSAIDPRLLEEAANAALAHGRHSSDALPLRQAVERFRSLLERNLDQDTRHRHALGLGVALRLLGERQPDSEALTESVMILRDALERTLDTAPALARANVQQQLGIALATLGERESGTERLEQAVAAFQAALEERTRERVPLDWAATQMNLGNALLGLGERESGTERLEQAVAAYRAALEEGTRERVPLHWALTQMNLGNALASLGERESGTERLEQAVAAFQAALEERTRERVPLDWAQTQMNLGNALASLGERESGTEQLEQAVAAYRAALEEWTRERVPLDWATSVGNRGVALTTLAERYGDLALAKTALDQIRMAHEAFNAAGHTQNAMIYQTQLERAATILKNLQEA